MMRKYVFLAIIASSLTGCVSPGDKIEVQTTKEWEGHYFTVSDFKEKTENISIEKNESIWVLSNRTLKRLLTNTRKDN